MSKTIRHTVPIRATPKEVYDALMNWKQHTSLLWSVFLEAGAEYPSTLGVLLESILDEPVFLTHPDYA